MPAVQPIIDRSLRPLFSSTDSTDTIDPPSSPGITAPPTTPVQWAHPFPAPSPQNFQGPTSSLLLAATAAQSQPINQLPFVYQVNSALKPNNIWTDRVLRLHRAKRGNHLISLLVATTNEPPAAADPHSAPDWVSPIWWTWNLMAIFAITYGYVTPLNWASMALSTVPLRLSHKMIPRERFRDSVIALRDHFASPVPRMTFIEQIMGCYDLRLHFDVGRQTQDAMPVFWTQQEKEALCLGDSEYFFEHPLSPHVPCVGVLNLEVLAEKRRQMRQGSLENGGPEVAGTDNQHAAYRMSHLVPDDVYEDPYIAALMIAIAKRQLESAEDKQQPRNKKSSGRKASKKAFKRKKNFVATTCCPFQAFEEETLENNTVFPVFLLVIKEDEQGLYLYESDIPAKYLDCLTKSLYEESDVPMLDIKYSHVPLDSPYGVRNQLETLMFNRLKG